MKTKQNKREIMFVNNSFELESWNTLSGEKLRKYVCGICGGVFGICDNEYEKVVNCPYCEERVTDNIGEVKK